MYCIRCHPDTAAFLRCVCTWLWRGSVCLSDVMTVVVRRRFETHHQAEAVGPAGGADRQVRVAPRGSRVLRRLPAPHAGAGPREEGHGRRVLAPPLACPLVETSSHCTFLPSPLPPPLSRDCNRSLSSLGISDEYLFLFFFCFIIFWITFVLLLN